MQKIKKVQDLTVLNSPEETDYFVGYDVDQPDPDKATVLIPVSKGRNTIVESITALEALTGTTDGQVVKVKGYYAGTPLDMPDYHTKPNSVKTPNGGSVIARPEGGNFEWPELSMINALCFGMKNSNDPLDKAINDSAWVRLKDYTKNIYFPSGRYYISQTMGGVTNGLDEYHIKGENEEDTWIIMETASDIDLIVLGWDNQIENLTFRQLSTAAGGSNGTMRLQSLDHPDIPTDIGGNDWTDPSIGGLSYRNRLTNVTCRDGQNYNIYGVNLAYTYFTNVKAQLGRGSSANCYIWGKGGSNLPETTTTNFYGGEFTASLAGEGIKIENSKQVRLYSAVCEGNFGRGILLENTRDITLLGGYLENNFDVNLGATTGDGDIVVVDSDTVNIQDYRILGNNSNYGIASSNTVNSSIRGGWISGLGGSVKALSIPGWQYSISPSAIYSWNNSGSQSGGDTFTRYADGSAICTLRRSFTSVAITSALGSLFVKSTAEVITDLPQDFLVYGDLSEEFTYSVHVLNGQGKTIWTASAGDSKLNNAVRFRFVAAESIASADIDVQILIHGRWRDTN